MINSTVHSSILDSDVDLQHICCFIFCDRVYLFAQGIGSIPYNLSEFEGYADTRVESTSRTGAGIERSYIIVTVGN